MTQQNSHTKETLGRWCEHFEGVENSFNQTIINTMQQFSPQSALSDPSCKGEILGSFSVGKAGGDNGLLPDLIKCCGAPLMDFIETLFTTVWRVQYIPAERCDTLLVPVSKKRNLTFCDNWRGTSLDIMAKLFARMIDDRQQLLLGGCF